MFREQGTQYLGVVDEGKNEHVLGQSEKAVWRKYTFKHWRSDEMGHTGPSGSMREENVFSNDFSLLLPYLCRKKACHCYSDSYR